jgi:AcrR family transcriptional regulator
MSGKRTPGARAGLSREQILDTALAIVDRDGLKALTMRGLGAALGVEAMTLYHYMPTKDALIDGLIERIFTTAAGPVDHSGDWRSRLRAYAESLRTTLLAHPGLLPMIARPAVTPATLDAVEATLRMLTKAGFPLARGLDTLNALTVFVIGHASAEAAIGDPGPPHGLDPQRHPLLFSAAASGAGSDDHERFRYAVGALLAGLSPSSDRTGPDRFEDRYGTGEEPH